MNVMKRLIRQLSNISQAYTRYPLTMGLFISFFIINAWYIIDEFSGYERLVQGFLVAILLSMVATHVNERFITQRVIQWGTLITSVILAVVYYVSLPSNDTAYLVYEVRTAVLIFALFIAFVWVPTIKNNVRYFYQMVLAIFKYSFITLLYGGILTLGFQAIISSINLLLFSISFDYFVHAANLIWLVFAPSYFLSLIPRTQHYTLASSMSEPDQATTLKEQDTDGFDMPTFLQVLINYIVIPLIGVYTVILIAYILLNIGGEFWSDNLLEPMLISYAIIVIFVYLLACNLTHPIAQYFRKIFPKILIPIVLFQTIASVLEIQGMGMTHGRYYVILFGVFSTIAGVLLSFLRKEKSGLIVPILLILAVMSVIPPIDAFTVSKNSQEKLLTNTLTENNMLTQNSITPKADISREDKEKITSSAEYLFNLEHNRDIAYLQEYDDYGKFQQVFGFPMTYPQRGDYDNQDKFPHYVFFERPIKQVMSITDEDYFLEMHLANYDDESTTPTIEINPDYTIRAVNNELSFMLYVDNQAGEEVLAIDLDTLFTQAFAASSANEQAAMTLIVENEEIGVRILALDLMKSEEESMVTANLYIFIDIKSP